MSECKRAVHFLLFTSNRSCTLYLLSLFSPHVIKLIKKSLHQLYISGYPMICLIARYAVFSPEGSSVNINRAVLIIYMEMNGHSKKIASVLQTIFYICFNTSFTFARMKCYANHYFCTDLAIQRHYLHFRISAILCRPDRQIQTKVLSTNNLESPDRDAISLNCVGERERETTAQTIVYITSTFVGLSN